MAMEKHFIQEGVIRSEIENFLKKELSRTGYSSVKIQKTPTATRIILYIEKPPLVIGKKGKRVNQLTKILAEKYGIDSPTIDVQRVENPTLDPNIVARRIAVALERGINRRRVAYKALRAIMLSGARGTEIVLSGKIIGKGGRSRVEKYGEGYMKKAGDSLKLVDIGSTQANLKAGVIGVTVKIVQPGTKFPDQITILEDVAKIKEKPVPSEGVPSGDMPLPSEGPTVATGTPTVVEEVKVQEKPKKTRKKKQESKDKEKKPKAAKKKKEVKKEGEKKVKEEKPEKAEQPKVKAEEEVKEITKPPET